MAETAAEKHTETERLAQAALDRAATHDTPPTPPAFEVFYAYEEGNDPQLTAAVDGAIASGSKLSSAAIGKLHDQFFSARSLELGVSDISDKVAEKLERLIARIGSGLAQGDAFEEELEASLRRLGVAENADDAAKLIERLMTISRSYMTDTRDMASVLDMMREQIGGLQEQLRTLQQEAFVDHLTQVDNRRRMDSVLSQAIVYARETGEPLCFALADIDKFKSINDGYGHAAGDKILMRFAELMQKNVRGSDTVARFGGEEFALILPRTPLKAANAITERIRSYFSEMRFVARDSGQRLGRVTVSFGVTSLRADDDMDGLIKRADELLYAAKKGGRNQVRASE